MQKSRIAAKNDLRQPGLAINSAEKARYMMRNS
jgi:hypothetical protein